MDMDFGWRTITISALVPMKKKTSILVNVDDLLKVIFHFDEGFTLRWAEPDERIYHRSGDAFVGVYLEHPRPSKFPYHHVFIKELCKYLYCIP